MRPESLGERGETQREGHRPDGRSNHDAIDGSGGHFGYRCGCRGDDVDVNVVFTQRIGNLRRRCIVFGHHDEPLPCSRKHSLDLRKHLFERLSSLDRLGEYGHSAHRQRAPSVLVGGNNVYGNMAELDLGLESSQHSPAVHVRQSNIERDRTGIALARQRQAGSAKCRHQGAKTLLASHVAHDL